MWGFAMNIEAQTIRTIRIQLAEIVAQCGDEPEKLMNRLEQLILDWFKKGLENTSK